MGGRPHQNLHHFLSYSTHPLVHRDGVFPQTTLSLPLYKVHMANHFSPTIANHLLLVWLAEFAAIYEQPLTSQASGS